MQAKDITTETKEITLSIADVLEAQWDNFILLLPTLAVALVILLIFVFLAGQARRLLMSRLGKRVDDPLLVRFVAMVVRWSFVIAGLMLALQLLGFTGIAGGLLAGAGISAFVVGFALKDIAENFLAGIILAFNRPFSIHDTVKVQEYTGKIISLNLRSTQIKTFDGKDIYIPNAIILKEPLVNFTRDGLLRLEFVVGIDYSDDVDTAMEVILENLQGLEQLVESDPPSVIIDEFGTNTVNLKVLFWVHTYDYKLNSMQLRSKAMNSVKKALLKHGFGLPANIQELKLYDKQPALAVEILQRQAEGPKGPAQLG